MKNILYFTTFLLYVGLNAQYTAIPDSNFEDYLENNGMGDGIPGNGQVLTANINHVAELDVGAEGIHDLTGIEDFTSLEGLACNFNYLTTLDVSNNQNLEYLLCNVNRLTSLTLNNPNLLGLMATENFLSTIDLSGSPLLEQIEIGDNRLTSLDISNNPNLILVNFSTNFLTEIDTSQNESLEFIFCSGNPLSILNYQNNIKLVWMSADYSSELISVDIRNGNNHNIVLFSTYGTEDLQCIYVDDASASYLDNWYKDDFTTFVNNEEECDALGVQEPQQEKIRFYPNPVVTKLTLENADLETDYIKIRDVNGKIIFGGNVHLGKMDIDFSAYPSGIYLLIFEKNGKILKSEKVIKK